MTQWLRSTCALFLLATVVHAEPIKIGDRLELFLDNHLIDTIQGDVKQTLIRPEPKEVVLVADAPWEGNTSGYYTVFRDGDLYRMIYRGWQHDEKKKAVHREVTCYAESKDGIRWTKPELGLFSWDGSKKNNIVWLGAGTHNFTAFRDYRPGVSNEAKYKAIERGRGGLLAFQSPDCKKWKLIQSKPVITRGAFDSQNLAFWDTHKKEYRAYWRIFTKGVRAIRTATSKDFIHWNNEKDLTYTKGTPNEHLYTNAVQKYFRAPHLYIGFPTRYLPREGQRVEPVLMSSRDGVHFHRYRKEVVPESAPKDRKGNRSNYMTWGMFQLPDKPNEISVYATENYYEKTPGRVRRFVYRVDGFVALRGGSKGGTVTTKPLQFEGQKLILNFVGRDVMVEALDASDKVIAKSKPFKGDAIAYEVKFEPKTRLPQGIRLRFTLKNADLFSMRFK